MKREKNLKVYGVYDDFRSGLALLSDNYFITDEYDDFLNMFFMPVNPDDESKKRPTPKKANVFSNINGMIVILYVSHYDKVTKGSVLGILESMKMMIELISDKDGIVTDILVEPGDAVAIGDPIMYITDDEK